MKKRSQQQPQQQQQQHQQQHQQRGGSSGGAAAVENPVVVHDVHSVAPPPPTTTAAPAVSLLPPASFTDIAERMPEVVLVTLSFCNATAIARLKATCRVLRDIAQDPEVWRQICLSVFRYVPHKTNMDALQVYKTWENMFMTRPRIRLDGVYVVSAMLIKYGTPVGQGMQEGGVDFFKPVFHVVHTRYLRFYSDGTMITMVSAEHPRNALKAIAAARVGKRGSCGVGTYAQNGDRVVCEFDIKLESHPRMLPIRQCYDVQLLSTKRGAWNRLRWLTHSQIEEDGTIVQHNVPSQPFRLVGFEGFSDRVSSMVCDCKMLNAYILNKSANKQIQNHPQPVLA